MGKIAIVITILMTSLVLTGVVPPRIPRRVMPQQPPVGADREEVKGTETIVVDGEPKPDVPLGNPPSYYLGIFKQISLSEDKSIALINHAVYSGLGLALVNKNNNFLAWLPEAEFKILGKGEAKYAGETFDWWTFEDIDNNTSEELAIQFGSTGTAGIHPFYLYSYKGNKFKLLLKLVEPASETRLEDLDGDGRQEIIHEYSLSGSGKLERDLLRWKDIWRLEDGEPIKSNSQFPEEYYSLTDLYQSALTKKEWAPDAAYYYPTLKCLKTKAELIIQGGFAEIVTCYELLSL